MGDSALEHDPEPDEDDVVPVFFLSDSTGISAETMGNALLIQFPDLLFERTLIPFISTSRRPAGGGDPRRGHGGPGHAAGVHHRRRGRRAAGAAADEGADHRLLRPPHEPGRGGARPRGDHQAARLHGVGDIKRYNNRMAAIEFTIEHDDGQSLRALEKADVILLAPSRCGKTPTSMYLALQHGLFVANYPLVDEDLERSDLPARCASTPSAASG